MTKVEYYLDIARVVAARSNCLVRRGFGAIIVKDDEIVATGYSGSARGALNCGKTIPCIKNEKNLPPNEAYEACPSVHAEENAIIHAGRSRALGGTLYLSPGGDYPGGRPCYRCRRRMINAGLKDCWYIGEDGELKTDTLYQWIEMENQWMKDRLES